MNSASVDDEVKEFYIEFIDKCVDLVSSVKNTNKSMEQIDETIYYIYETLIYFFEKLSDKVSDHDGENEIMKETIIKKLWNVPSFQSEVIDILDWRVYTC